MRNFTNALGAILSGSNSNASSPLNSPTTSTSVPSSPTSSNIIATAATGSTDTTPITTPSKKQGHIRSSSRYSLNIAGLIADTVHHEVKLVRYTEHLAQYHSDSYSSDDGDDYYGATDDRKSEKEVQRFFERDWDQHDWDADAEEWEEPEWSRRMREDKSLANSRKQARI